MEILSSVLIFVIEILIFLFPIMLFLKHDDNIAQANKKRLSQYMIQERAQLLNTHFPDCSYSYSEPLDKLIQKSYRKYEFNMKKNFRNCSVGLKHKIIEVKHIEEGHKRDLENAEKISYVDYFEIDIVPVLYQFMFAGSFDVNMSTFSVLKFAEKIGEKFASRNEIEKVRQTRTSDIIMLEKSGQISYKDISKENWERFVNTGILSEFTQLLKLWENIAYVFIEYIDGKLTFYIKPPNTIKGKPNYSRYHNSEYQCLEFDYLIEYSDKFSQTFNSLNNIADILLRL